MEQNESEKCRKASLYYSKKQKRWKINKIILCFRNVPPSRPYQQELITTDGVSLAYASVENSPYLECNLTENTETSKDNPNHNQIEENKTTETGSWHNFSVNPRPTCKSNAAVWRYIIETVRKTEKERVANTRKCSPKYQRTIKLYICCWRTTPILLWNYQLSIFIHMYLSLIHIWRCRRYAVCRSRWSPYH